MDKKQQLLVVIPVALALLVAVVYFVVVPKVQVYLQMSAELNDLRAKVNTARSVANSLKMVKDQYNQANLDLDKYGQLFDTEMRDGSNVILLGLQAATSQVQIMSITPGDITVKPNYQELPLNITAQGDYPNIINFCADIERLPNLSEIRMFKIQGAQVSSGQTTNSPSAAPPNSYIQGLDNPGDVTISMSVIIYMANTPQEKISLEEIRKWAIGRGNIFQPASGASSLPYLEILPQPVPLQPLNAGSLQQPLRIQRKITRSSSSSLRPSKQVSHKTAVK
ncbi:MAG: type 4a pilus biogenesis protein PilO [Thermacetogeniaceae bacterium]